MYQNGKKYDGFRSARKGFRERENEKGGECLIFARFLAKLEDVVE